MTTIDLARRAVACRYWRWIPGMLALSDSGPDSAPWVPIGRVNDRGDRPPGWCLPDLTDPATLGCLLALVRAAWGRPDVYAQPLFPGGWVTRPDLFPPPVSDTEAEALVAALEAAADSAITAAPAAPRLLYSARAALDAAGAPTTSPEGAPVSDGWRVRWVCAELAELRATLDNERGEGEPPHPSFKWDVSVGYEGVWQSTVFLDAEKWPVSIRRCIPTRWTFDGGRTSYPTARAAMRAASEAVPSAVPSCDPSGAVRGEEGTGKPG